MFTNKNKYLKCLWLIYGLCTTVIVFLVFYLNQEPSSVDITIKNALDFAEYPGLFDLKNFAYTLNSNSCSNNTFIILIVTSYAGDIETRSAVRQAYPPAKLEKLRIKRVFLLAEIHPDRNFNRIEQAAIANEHDRFGDIVQGNFIEDYKNLTYKHVMGLGWVGEYCSDATYVIKMDHDIVVDLFSIVTMLEKLPKRSYILAGYAMGNMKPIRERKSKWFVTYEEYSAEKYPEFLSGWLYITNPNTARLLYMTSKSVPYFWIDDTYVTGLLLKDLKIPLVRLNKYYTTYPEHLKCCIERPKFVCDFWVGPNGGETKLVKIFEMYAEGCFKEKCKKRSRNDSVRYNCVVRWSEENFGKPRI